MRRGCFVACFRALVVHPCPRQKVCKVFGTKEFSPDLVVVLGAKVESPACAGLGFLPELIVAAVSRVGGWGGTEAPRSGVAFSWG